MSAVPADPRRDELAANLARVDEDVRAACEAAGRPAGSVHLIAVTKTRPADDVALLADLGVRDVGESRDQEARPKAGACAGLGLTWHFIGQLQRNKVGSVVTYADVVESVDRSGLIVALDRSAGGVGRRLGVCLQVDLGDEGSGRGGASPADLPGLADQVAGCAHLELLGVMAVAPLGVDPAEPFARLAALHDRLLTDHPGATMRSAGMSADMTTAIAAGATHIRLGRALFGPRT